MPTLIRKSVFETNSSSCHSITIGGINTVPDASTFKHMLNENNEFILEFGEFGWEEETHTDVATLGSYLITYYENEPEQLKHIARTISKYLKIPDRKVIFKEKDSWSPRGYVDHQSDLHESNLFGTGPNEKLIKESILGFIFGNSELITDNDNH